MGLSAAGCAGRPVAAAPGTIAGGTGGRTAAGGTAGICAPPMPIAGIGAAGGGWGAEEIGVTVVTGGAAAGGAAASAPGSGAGAGAAAGSAAGSSLTGALDMGGSLWVQVADGARGERGRSGSLAIRSGWGGGKI